MVHALWSGDPSSGWEVWLCLLQLHLASAPSRFSSVSSGESHHQHLPIARCLTFLLILHEGAWK